jgi:hypothetical protein
MIKLLAIFFSVLFSAYSNANETKGMLIKFCEGEVQQITIDKVKILTSMFLERDAFFKSKKYTKDEHKAAIEDVLNQFEDSEFSDKMKYRETFGKNDTERVRGVLELFMRIQTNTISILANEIRRSNNVSPSDLRISRRFTEICRNQVF